MADEESFDVAAELHISGRRMFEDALLERNVCERKVLIEIHRPKYIGSSHIDLGSPQLLAMMGTLLLMGESMHNTVVAFDKNKTNNKKEDVRISMWQIAKFTLKNCFALLRQRWKGKKVLW